MANSKLRSIMAMYALALSHEGFAQTSDDLPYYKKDNPKESNDNTIENYKRQGLKEFFYGENSVWAINKKVADKKAKRKNYI